MLLYRRVALMAFLLALPFTLNACADLPTNPEQRAEAIAVNDPLEPMNRNIFAMNDFLDTYLIRPAALSWRFVVPSYVRDRIADALINMGEPVVFANDLLQWRLDSAGITLERFGLNTTVGAAGLWDVATGWGMGVQTGDFGQTLNSWNIKQGPYLVLPLFGPSNFRDAIGLGIDMAMSPWGYLANMGGTATYNRYAIASFGADGLTRREQNIEPLDALREGSLDFYAQMRSVYRQYRDKQLGGASTTSMPNFDESYP